MQWVSDWGPRVQKLIEIEQATGVTPQALLDAPVALGLERDLILAFNHLTSRRTVGMTPSPIQLTEIEAFIRLYGPPQMPIDIFVELLGEMDNEYLNKLSTTHGRPNRTRSSS